MDGGEAAAVSHQKEQEEDLEDLVDRDHAVVEEYQEEYLHAYLQ